MFPHFDRRSDLMLGLVLVVMVGLVKLFDLVLGHVLLSGKRRFLFLAQKCSDSFQLYSSYMGFLAWRTSILHNELWIRYKNNIKIENSQCLSP